MEREPRLSSIERVGELAHATLASAEELDDLESGLVGESVEELDRAVSFGVGWYGHEINISTNLNTSRLTTCVVGIGLQAQSLYSFSHDDRNHCKSRDRVSPPPLQNGVEPDSCERDDGQIRAE